MSTHNSVFFNVCNLGGSANQPLTNSPSILRTMWCLQLGRLETWEWAWMTLHCQHLCDYPLLRVMLHKTGGYNCSSPRKPSKSAAHPQCSNLARSSTYPSSPTLLRTLLCLPVASQIQFKSLDGAYHDVKNLNVSLDGCHYQDGRVVKALD